MSAGAVLLEEDFHVKAGRTDFTGLETPGNNPDYRLMLRSQMDLSDSILFDIRLRAVGERTFRAVPDYVEANAHLAWRVSDSFQLSLAGFNLLNEAHPEGVNDGARNEIRRSVYLRARWTR
jgi:iron complex outermembrane receptor protein